MNAKIFAHAAIALFLAGCFYSCKNENEDDFSEPREISFTEVWLKPYCWWNQSFLPEPPQGAPYEKSVTMINSHEELEFYISCLESKDFPDVDFSKQTLLLAWVLDGRSCINQLSYIRLYQISSTNFIIDLCIGPYFPKAVADGWSWPVGIIVDKLSEGSKVEVEVNNDWCQPVYDLSFEPIEIPITELPQQEITCYWFRRYKGIDVIFINSNEDFEKYFSCSVLEPEIYPSVDFSKHTLLLAGGCAFSAPRDPDPVMSLKQVGPEQYIFCVKVRIDSWGASILVPKLSNKATIELEFELISF